MLIPNVVVYLLTPLTFGVALLAAHVLLTSKKAQDIYRPLALFFLALAVSELPQLYFVGLTLTHMSTDLAVLKLGADGWLRLFTGLSLPAVIAFAPLVWCYVYRLTSEEGLWPKHVALHFALVAFAAIVAIGYVLLPHDVMTEEALTPDLPYYALSTVVAGSLLALTGVFQLQIGGYALAVLHRLYICRLRLKDYFASTEERELHWISTLAFAILFFWVLNIADLVTEFLGTIPLLAMIADISGLVTIWVFAIWGLRQAPSFARNMPTPPKENEEKPKKYERSALSREQSDRIARKIELSMSRDQLYRDPNLSLWDLAKHIGTSANYVSQTLNETIGETFFDYVNKWRIKDAAHKIETTDQSTLSIAYDVGFNSRSSFYRAFKREIGGTPGDLKRAANS